MQDGSVWLPCPGKGAFEQGWVTPPDLSLRRIAVMAGGAEVTQEARRPTGRLQLWSREHTARART